jgi:hypothetical protein
VVSAESEERDIPGVVAPPPLIYAAGLLLGWGLQRLWPRVWQLACSLDHVASPGDFYEHRIGVLSERRAALDLGESAASQT